MMELKLFVRPELIKVRASLLMELKLVERLKFI